MTNRKKSGKDRGKEYKDTINRSRRQKRQIEPSSAENRSILQRIPIFDRNTENEELIPIILDTDENKGSARKGKRDKKDIVRIVSVATAVFSLIAAITITSFAIYSAARSDTAPDESGTVSVQTEPDGKVIYVHQYDSDSGILTASELYERCKASAVSVLCKNADSESIGSGFVFDENGYIATAYHVVSEAEKITVIDNVGNEYTAKLISGNDIADIALLKIEATGLSPVSFGSSSELLVGEKVYAIGTPASLEYAGTLSSGEITYVSRTLEFYGSGGVLEKRMTVLQTNAQLNAGNSGCPVFDEYGRVVGMVTMRLGGNYDGIGFALPSDGVSAILSCMKSGTAIDSATLSGIATLAPRLGIIGETAMLGELYGYKITGFAECGSTSALLLREGDLIIEIDGMPIRRDSDITKAIGKKAPQDEVNVKVIRSGQSLTYTVRLGEIKL